MGTTKKDKLKFILIILLCFFTIKALVIPWSFFASLSFRMDFYDLGLISNFLSNTAKGKIFLVDDYGISHLSLHWTPTLFILVPFYHFFESQFITVILGNIIGCLGIAYFILFLYRNIQNKFNHKFFIITFIIFITLLFFANKYLNANFVAGHFEIIFLGFALLSLTMLLENRPLSYTIIPVLLALGVREDMGLFLAFQLFSLLFIPSKIIHLEKKTKKTIYLLIFICVLYVILNLTVFMPLMRTEKAYWINRYWSHWGNSWFEIIINVITQPIEVIKALKSSGITAFNEAFFYLGIFNPLQWICVHIPGMLLFLANATDKNHLFWYNSAMLLPGIYISTVVGFLVLTNFLATKSPKSIHIITIFMAILSIVMIIRMNRATNSENYSFKMNTKISQFDIAYRNINKFCEQEPQLFSSDLKTFVFLPNSKTKYLLQNYEKSEITILSTAENFGFSDDRCHPSENNENCRQGYENFLTQVKQNPNFSILYQDSYYLIFYNKQKMDCTIQ